MVLDIRCSDVLCVDDVLQVFRQPLANAVSGKVNKRKQQQQKSRPKQNKRNAGFSTDRQVFL